MLRRERSSTFGFWRGLAAFVAVMLSTTPSVFAGAQFLDVHSGLPDFDSRAGEAQPPSAQALAIVQGLGARASWNSFGTPGSLIKYGGYLATGQTGDPVTAAKNWIRANKALFRLSDAGVDSLELLSDSTLSGYGGHAVIFRQTFGGLPATQDGMITVGIVSGKVAYVSSSAVGDQVAPGAASITPVDAWVRAALNVGRIVSPGDVLKAHVDPKNGWTILNVSGFTQPQYSRLVAFPTVSDGVRPAYEINVIDLKGGELIGYTLFVDAQTGAVLFRRNAVQQAMAQDVQTFQGAYTFNAGPPATGACGPNHDFVVGPGEGSIDVTASATIVTNDIVLKLLFNNVTVASADTATSPEAIHYSPGGGVAPGTYTVQVCPFLGDGIIDSPQTAPFTYAGTFSVHPVGTSTFPYPPRWRWFLANPPLDYSSTDTRKDGCWETTVDGAPVPDCDTPPSPLINFAARAPWDHEIQANRPSFTSLGNAANTAEAWLAADSPFGSLGPGPFASRPVSNSRDYRFPWTNQWETSNCSPTVFASPDRNDIEASVTHLFSVHNRMHDWSYFLGFTERNFNLQENNFGLTAPGPFPAGRENDPEIGSAQAGGISGAPPSFLGRDNANQLTLQDGIPGLTNQYLFQSIGAGIYVPCVDGTFDMSIVGHEYTHAISNRMVGGPDSGLLSEQGGAMGESWSDQVATEFLMEHNYLPTSNENPWAVGPYATGNKQIGIRNYSLDANPLTYGEYGYDSPGPEIHSDGEIWNGVGFDIRQGLVAKYNAQYPASNVQRQLDCAENRLPVTQCPGNRRWIQIVFDAFLLMPADVSMLGARDAYLAADLMRTAQSGWTSNQKELWRAFANRGLGEKSSTTSGDDTDPVPSFESPLENEVNFRFVVVDKDTSAPIPARIYVGNFEARATPIADTDPGTTLSDQAKFLPGKTFPFLVVAPGYGHVRFPRFVWSGFVGQTVVLTTKMPKNRASLTHGATASGDGVNLDKLIDDTEATNWAVLNRATGVNGAQVTVKLAGGAQKVSQVNVSAIGRPADENDPGGDTGGQSRFAALRQFEIWGCIENASPLNLACNGTLPAGFTKFFTSAANAFPGEPIRPLSPFLNLRSFTIPGAPVATHVQLRVLTNQCTGNPKFQGDQDADPVNDTDCRTTLNPLFPSQGNNVRASELQVFSSGPATPPQDPAVVFTMTAPATAKTGTALVYGMSYNNLGPAASSNARVTDVLPTSLTFVSASHGGTYNAATRTVTWNLGTVAVGQTGTLTLNTIVTAAAGATVVNTADFSADLTAATPAAAVTVVVP